MTGEERLPHTIGGVTEKHRALLVSLPTDEKRAMKLLSLYPQLPHYLFMKPSMTTTLPFHLFRMVFVWMTPGDFDRALETMKEDVKRYHSAGGV